MKAKFIMGTQLISLLIAVISANGIINDILASIIFLISFSLFAICSIYISKHSDRLLKEIEPQ